MEYLCIENFGEIDARGLSLFGASVKGEDAIGMFGSGTKYSIATLLRNNIGLRIFSGEREIIIEKKPTSFRNQSFEVITVDGCDTSITTATGTKWRVDQAVREFYSNALDEGGADVYACAAPFGTPGRTRVYIEMALPIETMWDEWNKYFLDPTQKSLAKQANDAVYYVEATGNVPSIMRRGVWCVEDWQRLEAIFSYNLSDVNLPETRLVPATAATTTAGLVIGQITEPRALDMLIKQANNTGSFEWLCLSYTSNISGGFKAHMLSRYKWIATSREIEYFPQGMRNEVLVCTPRAYRVLLTCGLKDIKDFRNSDEIYTEMAWPIGYSDRVNRAIKQLNQNGIDYNFRTKFVVFSDEPEVLAKADMRSGQCLLTNKVFEDSSDRTLTKALIEEWTHLRHRVLDGSIAQQHVYLDTIFSLLK